MVLRERNAARMLLGIAVAIVIAVSFGMPEASLAKAKKPAQVKGIKITSSTYNTASFKWNKAKRAKKYEIYRASQSNGAYVKIKTLKGKSFTDKGLYTGQRYYYKVRAVGKKSKKGKFSKVISVVPRLKAPILSVAAAGEGNRAQTSVSGANGYYFYRDGALLAKQASATCLDASAKIETTYTYQVVAYRVVNGKEVKSSASGKVKATRPRVSIEQARVPYDVMYQGVSYTIKGRITSYVNMSYVGVGVMEKNESGEWVWNKDESIEYKNYGKKEFRILSQADSVVNFGKLAAGEYRYRVRVELTDGTTRNLVDMPFQIIIPTVTGGGKAIAAKAEQLAWPYGTKASVYKYSGGQPTAAYKAALNQVFPNRSKWGAKPKAGASCDVFVGTSVRASGYDIVFPRGLDEIEEHMAMYPNLWRRVGTNRNVQPIRGDVIYMYWNGGSTGHVCIYLGTITSGGKKIEAVANAHYGSGGKYGVIEKFSSICKSRSYTKYYVYRPIR